jgi:putative PIN family toxin of toxin-antitoxin system
MIRVVLDTNVIVSAFITYGGNEWNILQKAVEGKITLITSENLLDEFLEVISRQKFGYDRSEIESMRLFLIEISHFIIPLEKVDIIKEDLEDNRFLECAISGKAQYIISGDRHLLNLRKYKSIKILRSVEFLRILEGR